jgi:hypothetical protein
MIPISRKIMMSLECSITKAIMEFTLTVARSGYFSSPPGWKISTVPWRKCEVDHRGLIRFDPSWKGEGVFLPLHPARSIGGVFLSDQLPASGKASYLTEKVKH